MAQPKTHDRRAVILDHAADLFAAKGISATTVREIADAVGILSGSLYHHFKSKDDMVDAIVSDYLTDLTERYSQVTAENDDPATQLTELVRASLVVIEAHPHATEIYQNSGQYLTTLQGYDHIKSAANSISRTWIKVLEAGARSGAFRADVPPKVLYRLIRDALWLAVRWFKPTGQYSTRRFADDFVSTFLDGIVPR